MTVLKVGDWVAENAAESEERQVARGMRILERVRQEIASRQIDQSAEATALLAMGIMLAVPLNDLADSLCRKPDGVWPDRTIAEVADEFANAIESQLEKVAEQVGSLTSAVYDVRPY